MRSLRASPPTSTPEQLELAGKLLQEYPNLYMHTHLSENRKEIEWVKELFPERKGYLDVYDHHKLIGPRAVFAHGVHLCDDECKRLAETGSAVAFCPTSNLFLGSGLLDLNKLEAYGVRVGLGTDVGAGTSFSQLQSLNEAYKVMQLQGKKLDPFKSLYLATLGGANALYPTISWATPARQGCRLPGAGLQRHAADQLMHAAGHEPGRTPVRPDHARRRPRREGDLRRGCIGAPARLKRTA